MSTFLGIVLSWWIFGAFVSAPFFWFKRVDRSLAPITRRFLAIGYGLTWPYLLFNFLKGRRQAALSSTGVAGSTGAAPGTSAGNPFRADALPQAPAGDTSPASNPFRD